MSINASISDSKHYRILSLIVFSLLLLESSVPDEEPCGKHKSPHNLDKTTSGTEQQFSDYK